jgi:hypothetical protein
MIPGPAECLTVGFAGAAFAALLAFSTGGGPDFGFEVVAESLATDFAGGTSPGLVADAGSAAPRQTIRTETALAPLPNPSRAERIMSWKPSRLRVGRVRRRARTPRPAESG